jgi:hypothetical protein
MFPPERSLACLIDQQKFSNYFEKSEEDFEWLCDPFDALKCLPLKDQEGLTDVKANRNLTLRDL